MLIDFLIAR